MSKYIDNAAMGSPLPPVIANLYNYYGSFEKLASDTARHKSEVWKRYADDTCSLGAWTGM